MYVASVVELLYFSFEKGTNMDPVSGPKISRASKINIIIIILFFDICLVYDIGYQAGAI